MGRKMLVLLFQNVLSQDLTTLPPKFAHSLPPKLQEQITHTIICNLKCLSWQNANNFGPKPYNWTLVKYQLPFSDSCCPYFLPMLSHESFNPLLKEGMISFCWKLFWYYTLIMAIPLNRDGKPKSFDIRQMIDSCGILSVPFIRSISE